MPYFALGIRHCRLPQGWLHWLAWSPGSWLIVENAVMRSRLATLESQQRDADLHREILKRQLAKEPRGRSRLATAAAIP